MIELLAIPEWEAPPRTVADWLAGLEAIGQTAHLETSGSEGDWIEIPALRVSGFLLIENGDLAAIHYELHDPDPLPARDALDAVAAALRWEIHDDKDSDGPDEIEDD